MKIALDTNVMAYAEGANGTIMRDKALKLIQRLPSGAVVLPVQPNLAAIVSGGKLQFNWALATGTFQVQTANQPTGPWTTLTLPLTTNGANVSCLLTPSNQQQQFYRLLGQ